MGDGVGVHRVEPVCRRNAFEGAVSRDRHGDRRGDGRAARTAFRRVALSVQRDGRAVGRRDALPGAVRSHRAFVRIPARGLYAAAHRAADGHRADDDLQRRDRAYRGNPARHHLRERGRLDRVSEPARADADSPHRRVVPGRRAVRARSARRAQRRCRATAASATARGCRQGARRAALATHLRSHEPRRRRARLLVARTHAVVPAGARGAERSARGIQTLGGDRACAAVRTADRGHLQVDRRAAAPRARRSGPRRP
ncbi:hypothetical protein LMG29739_00765 [Paraburkholderia solisilvae]|uniref:Uncharacterized protein n=1 Tax=Paraburkholderia solisilvae TaxID=624376 RepID=A0A6J5D514_9BURK|nr:hypothetical protein LMG29739_00765 [Paraburkholderia solisilvae]